MFFKKLFNASNAVQTWEQPLFDRFSVPTTSGETISETNALTVGVIYACINIKANAIAKLPLQVFKKGKKGRERETAHQVSRLLETRPNKYQTPFTFKHTLIVHKNLWGTAYIKKEMEGNNVKALTILDPARMTVVTDINKKIWYQYADEITGQPITYDTEELIVLPYLSTDGITGKSPIAIARETAGTMKAAQKFLGSFYKNGTLTKGVLKTDQALNREAKAALRQAWSDANAGIENGNSVAIVDAGMDFQSITMPLQDAEFIASQKFNVTEIARIFNVPLHKLGELDKATFSNIEHQAMEFISDCIQPEIVSLEEELNYKLFTTKEMQKYYCKFNLTSALRGDNASRAAFYKEMLGLGAYTINEVRDLEEKDAIENGDRPLVSLNFTFLDMLEAYQKEKAAGKGGGKVNGK